VQSYPLALTIMILANILTLASMRKKGSFNRKPLER